VDRAGCLKVLCSLVSCSGSCSRWTNDKLAIWPESRDGRIAGSSLSFYISLRFCTSTALVMSASYDSKSIRTASVTRKTAETNISCTITLDHAPGVKQDISIKTGIGFLDHVGSSPCCASTVALQLQQNALIAATDRRFETALRSRSLVLSYRCSTRWPSTE